MSESTSTATVSRAQAAPVGFAEILRFYLPLVLTSQMMTLTGPLLNFAVSRAADAKTELAGYWIGFTILLFIESACMSSQSTTASLARGRQSMRRLFMTALGVGVFASVMVLLVARTRLGDPIFDHLIHTTPEVEALARAVLLYLTPIPILIALRGVANGVAIRESRTMLVARATLARVTAIAIAVGLIVLVGTGSGARAGATAFVTGILLEASVVWFSIWPHWKRRQLDEVLDRERLSFGDIARFASPLVIAAFAWTSFRPLVNGILGQLPDPVLAQAGFGVVMPLMLLTSSPIWALQNVSLMMPETMPDLRRVLRFGVAIGIAAAGVIFLLVISPLSRIVMRDVFALSAELEAEVMPALVFISLEPIALCVRSLSQGLLMRAKRTGIFAIVSPIKVALVLTVGLYVTSTNPDVNGTALGTLLLVGADGVEATVYGLRATSLARRGLVFGESAGVRRVRYVARSD